VYGESPNLEADRGPTGDPVVAHDVTVTAPKPLREMTPEDHEAHGRAMREAVLGLDPDEPEEP
jgi:hypothetical protein